MEKDFIPMVIQGSTRGTLGWRRWFLQLHGSVMLWSYHAIRWELNASKFESNPVMGWSKAFCLVYCLVLQVGQLACKMQTKAQNDKRMVQLLEHMI